MARACRYKHKLLGRGKATAYGIDTEGRRRRLTREQLRTGRLPDGIVEIVFTGPGHVSDHALTTDPGLLRLTPAQATALVNAGPRDHTTRTSAAPTEHTGTYTFTVKTTNGQDLRRSANFEYDTYRIGGRTVTFGGIPGVEYDAEVIPRNPYVISGAAPDTPEGHQAALDYAYAHIALTEAANRCETCGLTQSCALCTQWVLTGERAHLAPHDHLIPRSTRPAADHRHTAVDALLLAATEGDPLAAAELQALATAGRAMVESVRRQQARHLLPERIEHYLRPYAQAVKDKDAAWDTSADRYQELTTEIAALDAALDADITQAGEASDAIAKQILEASREIERLAAAENTPAAADELVEAEHRRDTLQAEYSEASERVRRLNMIEVARQFGTACLDGEGLYLVHETAYDLEHDDAGNLLLRPRGDHAADGLRDAIHFALNHAVKGHLSRGGGDARRALVIDLKALMEANPGALTTVFPVDTRVIPPPRQPIVIPAHAAKVIEYAGEAPEARTELVAQAVREAGGPVFEGGQHYSTTPEAAPIADVLAAYIGAGCVAHHASGERNNEKALSGPPYTTGGVGQAGPHLDAARALALGEHGLARLFDRGGEPPYGRPVELAWTGADIGPVLEEPTGSPLPMG